MNMAGIGVTRPVADRGVGRREVLERSFWQIPGKGPAWSSMHTGQRWSRCRPERHVIHTGARPAGDSHAVEPTAGRCSIGHSAARSAPGTVVHSRVGLAGKGVHLAPRDLAVEEVAAMSVV